MAVPPGACTGALVARLGAARPPRGLAPCLARRLQKHGPPAVPAADRSPPAPPVRDHATQPVRSDSPRFGAGCGCSPCRLADRVWQRCCRATGSVAHAAASGKTSDRRRAPPGHTPGHRWPIGAGPRAMTAPPADLWNRRCGQARWVGRQRSRIATARAGPARCRATSALANGSWPWAWPGPAWRAARWPPASGRDGECAPAPPL